jgi:NhaP-type Na+/H+ or K+/H+ antiporter
MLNETQRETVQWFLTSIIVVCVARLIWVIATYIQDKRRRQMSWNKFFKKMEEYRNDI